MSNPFLKIMVHLKFLKLLKYLNINNKKKNKDKKINDIKDLFNHQIKMILLFFIQKNIKMLLKNKSIFLYNYRKF